MQDDDLVENRHDDDVGDIYMYSNVVPNSACDFAGLCCGLSIGIRLLDGDTGRHSIM